MSAFDGIRRVFRVGIGGGDAERELERELAFHFEETTRRLVEGGMDEAEARREAERRFGDAGTYRRELRRLARGRNRRVRARDLARSGYTVVRDAVRGLVRAPGLAAAVVAIMALGLGANATMFGVLDRLFLTPPAHLEAPGELRRFLLHGYRVTSGEAFVQTSLPYPDWRDWWELEAFQSTAAWSPQRLVVGNGDGAERVPAVLASASLFPTLGVRPALGRFFGPSEDRFGADPVAVLGHGFWRGRYGGDPGVLGEVITVGDERYTVIGVAPPGFTGVDLERVDVWLPLHRAGMVEEGGTDWVDSRGWYWLRAVARLAPGVTPEAASAAATAAHRAGRADQLAEADVPPALQPRIELSPLLLARTGRASREDRVVPWLMGVALMVLLLTCANVANLLLARGARRRRETAVRLALGVSRARLVATVVAEALLLALLGAAAAVAVAIWGGQVVRGLLVPDAGWQSGRDVVRILAFSGGLAVAAGLLAALTPAWRATRPRTTEALKAGGMRTTRSRSTLRTGLLVFQAAITVLLLVGTGLFVSSLRQARGVDLGFEPDPVLLARIEPAGGYPGGEAMTALYRTGLDRVRALPGVQSAAISTTTPFRNARGIGDDLRVPGLDSLPRTDGGGAYIHAVTGDYFETLGLDLRRGRGITDADDAASAPGVAVVNETMARLVWPGGDALGACLVLRDAPCATVVGIVEDHHRFELSEAASMHYYVPMAKAPYPWPPSRLMVRSPEPVAIAPSVRAALQEALPGARLITTEPFRDIIDPSYRSWSLGATLFGVFGLLALLVAGLGLYSVLAFDVAERRSELGLRAALGASHGRLVRHVLAGGLMVAGAGVVLGLLSTALAARRVEPLLFGVDPFEPAVLLGVAATVLLVATGASALPAWRAARADPGEALRGE